MMNENIKKTESMSLYCLDMYIKRKNKSYFTKKQYIRHNIIFRKYKNEENKKK